MVQLERKLWSGGRALCSRSEGRGLYPHPILDGSGVEAKPGLIPAPNYVKKVQVAKWGTPENI